MDNIQGQGTSVAPQGQAAAPVQMPSSDASGQSAVAPVVSGAARTDGSVAGQEGLILGKFKSNDDLAKAYQELESHSKKVEMDRAELEKIFINQPEAPSTAPQAPAAAQDSEDPLSSISDALAPRLTSEVNRLISPVLARMEVDQMVRKHGDAFVATAQEVKTRQQQNPSLSLEDAFKLVSFDRLQRTNQETQRQQVAVAQQAAQVAQVETAQSSGYKAPSIEDAINDPKVSVGEIAEALGPDFADFARESKARAGRNRK